MKSALDEGNNQIPNCKNIIKNLAEEKYQAKILKNKIKKEQQHHDDHDTLILPAKVQTIIYSIFTDT